MGVDKRSRDPWSWRVRLGSVTHTYTLPYVVRTYIVLLRVMERHSWTRTMSSGCGHKLCFYSWLSKCTDFITALWTTKNVNNQIPTSSAEYYRKFLQRCDRTVQQLVRAVTKGHRPDRIIHLVYSKVFSLTQLFDLRSFLPCFKFVHEQQGT